MVFQDRCLVSGFYVVIVGDYDLFYKELIINLGKGEKKIREFRMIKVFEGIWLMDF